MNNSDKVEFSKLMTRLFYSFGRDIDKMIMAVYFDNLSHLTLFQVSTAIEEIISRDEKFPVSSRISTLAATKRKEKPEPIKDVPQIEEIVLSNDLPRTKEDFFIAMDKLTKKVSDF